MSDYEIKRFKEIKFFRYISTLVHNFDSYQLAEFLEALAYLSGASKSRAAALVRKIRLNDGNILPTTMETIILALKMNYSPTDIASEFGISRSTYYRWKEAYEEQDGDMYFGNKLDDEDFEVIERLTDTLNKLGVSAYE